MRICDVDLEQPCHSGVSHKPRVLFLGEGVTMAHLLRPMELAFSLDASQYEVHFACDPLRAGLRVAAMNDQIAFHPIRSIAPDKFLRRLAAGTPVYAKQELCDYVRDELELLHRVRPDVVIGDFRVTLSISAELLGIPHFALAHGHWSPHCTRTTPLPEHTVVRIFGETLSRIVFRWAEPAVFRLHIRHFNSLRRAFGLEPVASLREMYTRGTQTLYLDLPELSPVACLSAHHQYLGPLPVEPEVPLPTWRDSLPSGRPVIFVSPGSSGDARAVRTLIASLAEMPVTVMAATAGRIGRDKLPQGVFAEDYLPGSWAARKADVVICNGGSGTVYQALWAGRPVLGVPSNLDQHFVMESVAESGAGILLRAGKVGVRRVRVAVRRLLEEKSFAACAQKLSREMAKWDASTRFASILEDFLQRRSIESTSQ